MIRPFLSSTLIELQAEPGREGRGDRFVRQKRQGQGDDSPEGGPHNGHLERLPNRSHKPAEDAQIGGEHTLYVVNNMGETAKERDGIAVGALNCPVVDGYDDQQCGDVAELAWYP